MTIKNKIPGLELDQYRRQIKLDEPFETVKNHFPSENEKENIVTILLNALIRESFTKVSEIPEDYVRKRQLLRALLNIRPPAPMNDVFLQNLNCLLQHETKEKQLVDAENLKSVSDAIPGIKLKNRNILVLWKGDITCLKADAIINAANERMLGCFQPLHNCIDNVIHSAAGPLLRHDCKIIMNISKIPEQTGDAKITRAYNLPSKYVIHTVGPIIQNEPVPEFQQNQLASCYRSCLALAAEIRDIKTIAFPCISTGVFNFPRKFAAEIAVQMTEEWLTANLHHFDKIIFNVFLQEDFDEYFRVFGKL